jgi:hypothetical protein
LSKSRHKAISSVQGTAFAGLGTAVGFKLYGCAWLNRNAHDVEGFAKCNELADHAIAVTTAIITTMIH